MISNAGKKGILLIQDFKWSTVYNRVDATKDPDVQFNEFTRRAEDTAKNINGNINDLFSRIESFQKGLDVNDCKLPYQRDKLIRLAKEDLIENLQLKHALVVLQGKDFIRVHKDYTEDLKSTEDLQGFISSVAQ